MDVNSIWPAGTAGWLRRAAADMRELEAHARDKAVFTEDDQRLRKLSHVAIHAESFARSLENLAAALDEVSR